MGVFLRILGYARPLGMVVPQYLLLIVPATVFSVVNLTALIPLLQVLFDQVDSGITTQAPVFSTSLAYVRDLFYHYLNQIIHTEGRLRALYFICGLIIASVFLANIFRYLSQLVLAKVRVRVIQNLRNDAFHAITNFDLGYFTTTKKGDIISRITTDVQDVEQSAVSALKVVIKEPVLIIGYFIALLSISAELTLYSLILIPIAGVAVSIVARRIRVWARRSQESLGQISSTLDESISGMRMVKAFNAKKYVRDRFQREVGQYARQAFHIATKSNLAAPISETMGVMVLSVILAVGGGMVLSEGSSLDAAGFIGFLVVFSQMLNPAKAISVAIGQINRGLASAQRVFALVDTQSQIREPVVPREIQELHQEIRFDQVGFAYDQDAVLRQVSFNIPKGKMVALVGPSGGGKSTIADLLCRFYDPTSGEVTVDGLSLKAFSLNSWRSMIGVVSQEPVLFNDTLENNIRFGNETATMAQIERAAKVANAHAFILNLPHGYQTLAGEGGSRLSGGEKQRITIARAVLKNPPILILDEATSSLDAKSEELVQAALFKLMQNRTTLVIAHRLSTVQHADEIIVINNGAVEERGTHRELAASSGLYQQLTELQTF